MTLEPLDIQILKDTLRHLYDPMVLRRSHLASAFAILSGDESPTALRQILIEAIHSLKPPMNLPQASKAWRIYHILAYRYIEQSTQKQVATELGLGIRQLRRLEVAALQTLAETLEIRRVPSRKVSPSHQEEIASHETVSLNTALGTEQELELLRKTSTSQLIEIVPFVENILHTVMPLMESMDVRLVFTPNANLPPAYGQPTPIRHSIINVLSTVGQSVSGGLINLTLEPGSLVVTAAPEPGKPLGDKVQLAEAVKLGQRLMAFSGCTMELTIHHGEPPGLMLRISLPRSSLRNVLALDDNLDALRLIERYLSGSSYRLSGLQDPSQLISVAETLRPDIILLDVMLAGIDGWELLGRLREHPLLGKTPVIISTILPQESLALALGAAAFLKKPVSQESLLQTLDWLLSGFRAKELP